MDTDSIVKEWRAASARHPMFGEGMSEESMGMMWESGSSSYSDARYSVIRDGILDALLSEGLLGEDDSVIDIGSGPGTFAVPFSGRCRSVLCVDGSEGMLRRIEDAGISNISTLRMDCRSLSSGYRRDVAFCSLCPPMNCPEGIDLMEALGGRRVYVSSANREKGLEGEIWAALGKDYSYEGYDTDYPYRYLLSRGRDAEVRYFTQDCTVSETVEAAVDRFRSLISNYRTVGAEEERAIRDVVSGHAEDGMVVQRLVLRMGMLTW